MTEVVPGKDWTPVGKGTPKGIWLEVKTDVAGFVAHNYFKAMAHMPFLGEVSWVGADGKAIEAPTHWKYGSINIKAAPKPKPFNGSIQNWQRDGGFCSAGDGLGYVIYGEFLNHPVFGRKYTYTSYVVAWDKETGMVETRNSRYKLIGEEKT